MLYLRPCLPPPQRAAIIFLAPSPWSAPALKAGPAAKHRTPSSTRTSLPSAQELPVRRAAQSPAPTVSLSSAAMFPGVYMLGAPAQNAHTSHAHQALPGLADLRAQATPMPLTPHLHQATHTCFCAGVHTHHAGWVSGSSGVRLESPHLSAGGHGFGTENSAESGSESGTRSGSGSVRGGQNGSSLHRDGSGSWSESWSGSWRSSRQKRRRRRRRSGGCRRGTGGQSAPARVVTLPCPRVPPTVARV